MMSANHVSTTRPFQGRFDCKHPVSALSQTENCIHGQVRTDAISPETPCFQARPAFGVTDSWRTDQNSGVMEEMMLQRLHAASFPDGFGSRITRVSALHRAHPNFYVRITTRNIPATADVHN